MILFTNIEIQKQDEMMIELNLIENEIFELVIKIKKEELQPYELPDNLGNLTVINDFGYVEYIIANLSKNDILDFLEGNTLNLNVKIEKVETEELEVISLECIKV